MGMKPKTKAEVKKAFSGKDSAYPAKKTSTKKAKSKKK